MQRRRAAALLLTGALGCGQSGSTPDRPPPPPGSSATAAGNGSAATAATSPAWSVAENPDLTLFLTGAEPACVRTEALQRDQATYSRSYAVYAPSVPQSVLEERFRAAAHKLGLPLAPALVGLQATDEARGIGAFLSDSRLSVIVRGTATLQSSTEELARRAGAETAGLLSALAATASYRSASLERPAGGGMTFQVEMDGAKPERATIDRWAEAAHLNRDGELWLRRYRPEAPDVPVIQIDPRIDGQLHVLETRIPKLEGPECQSHPSRAEPSRDAGAKDEGAKDADANATMDDLVRQMMGK